MKIQVTEAHYKDMRNAEAAAGKKLKDLFVAVPDCIEGVHGVYRVRRCYRTAGGKYIADMLLLEKAENAVQARLQTLAYMKRKQGKQ